MWGGIIALGVILILLCAGIAVGLAFIPACMASKKDYSFGLFWLFGLFLLIPAIITAAVIEPRAKCQMAQPAAPADKPPSNPEQVKQLEKLVEQGLISETEYDTKKKEFMGF